MNKQERRRHRRRQVLAGFPIESHPLSRDELDRYFTAESCVCLLCGRKFKAIGTHLKLHDLTPDEYRSMYGIPWRFGIASGDNKQRHSELSKAMVAEGVIPATTAAQLRERMEGCNRRGFARLDWARDHILSVQPIGVAVRNANAPKVRQAKSARWQSMTPEERSAVLAGRRQTRSFGTIGGLIWRGRKQSPEHVAKRIAASLETKATR